MRCHVSTNCLFNFIFRSFQALCDTGKLVDEFKKPNSTVKRGSPPTGGACNAPFQPDRPINSAWPAEAHCT